MTIKVYTNQLYVINSEAVMVNNMINNHLSPQIIVNKIDNDIRRLLLDLQGVYSYKPIQIRSMLSHK